MSTVDKTTFENGRPVPQADGVRSGWTFGIDEERQRNITLYHVYTSGQMRAWTEHWQQRALDEKLLRAKNYLRKLRARRAHTCDVVQFVND
tara:strand:+ start:420 stop:692 length:273 start_codon:yes stop_codon:yes gene_type:complete